MNDIEHNKALEKTGFWGKQAAGCLIMAKSTGRFLVQKRGQVEQPNTWGTWGGAIDVGNTPIDTIYNEFEEETGHSSNEIEDLIPLHTYTHPTGFKYYNYLAIVEDEFLPHINNSLEVIDYKWVNFGQWPEPLHFGLIELLKHANKKLQSIVMKNQHGEKLLESVLNEHIKLHPNLAFNQLKRNRTVTAYHASESPTFEPVDNKMLHIGSIQQSEDLIKNMRNKYPNKKFYLYELTVDLGVLCPKLFDEDPSDDVDFTYGSYAYINRIEFPQGSRRGQNISLLITYPSIQILDKKLIKSYET